VLAERLVWIGGSTASGKTSIADYLAEKYGLEPYHVDRFDEEHLARRNPEAQPALEAWARRTLDETWVDLLPDDLVEATLELHRERFPSTSCRPSGSASKRSSVGERRGRCRDEPAIPHARSRTGSTATSSWRSTFATTHASAA
jgi:hypothetical protein